MGRLRGRGHLGLAPPAVLCLLMLHHALAQVGVVGQLVEQRGHHRVTVHLLLFWGRDMESGTRRPPPTPMHSPTDQIKHLGASRSPKVGKGLWTQLRGQGFEVRAPGLPSGLRPAPPRGSLRPRPGPSVHCEAGVGLFSCADDGSSRHLPLRGGVRLTSKSAMFFPSQTLSVSTSPWLMNGLLSLGCPSPVGRGSVRQGGVQ